MLVVGLLAVCVCLYVTLGVGAKEAGDFDPEPWAGRLRPRPLEKRLMHTEWTLVAYVSWMIGTHAALLTRINQDSLLANMYRSIAHALFVACIYWLGVSISIIRRGDSKELFFGKCVFVASFLFIVYFFIWEIHLRAASGTSVGGVSI